MKRDFSQLLNSGSTHYVLLIQEFVSGKFLLFRSTLDFEEDWHETLSLMVAQDEQLSLALIKYLQVNGLVLNSYRSLANNTTVSFSFIDDTPGSESREECLLVVVDVMAGTKLNTENSEAVFVRLHEVLDRMSFGPYMPTTLEAGVVQLLNESNV